MSFIKTGNPAKAGMSFIKTRNPAKAGFPCHHTEPARVYSWRIQVWVRPISEKPMKPRTSSFLPPSVGVILTE